MTGALVEELWDQVHLLRGHTAGTESRMHPPHFQLKDKTHRGWPCPPLGPCAQSQRQADWARVSQALSLKGGAEAQAWLHWKSGNGHRNYDRPSPVLSPALLRNDAPGRARAERPCSHKCPQCCTAAGDGMGVWLCPKSSGKPQGAHPKQRLPLKGHGKRLLLAKPSSSQVPENRASLKAHL